MKSLVLTGIAALILAVSSPASASDLDDATIFAIFDQANMADIATGRMGWKKSKNADVRALAKMVVTDHTTVQQMGRDLAKELNILGTPPENDTSWASQAKTLQALEQLEGRAFDEAYLRHEVAYHTAVINAINSVLLPSVKNEKFKALINQVLPGFEHHLMMTKKTADKLGVSY